MLLFRRERDEEEARAAMKALDETVNADAKKQWTIDLRCHGRQMTQDPRARQRFICSVCNAVLNITTERRPDPDKL